MNSAQVARVGSTSTFLPTGLGVGDEASALDKIAAEFVISGRDTSLSGVHKELMLDIASAVAEAQDDDWDGYCAASADPGAVAFALRLATHFPEIPQEPEISIDTDGEVNFEWFISSRNVFTMSIGRHGRLHYACRIEEDKYRGAVNYSDKLPKQIYALLMELFDNV